MNMPITEMHISERTIFNARILPTYSLVSSFCLETFLISIVLKPKSATIKQIPAKEYANDNLPPGRAGDNKVADIGS